MSERMSDKTSRRRWPLWVCLVILLLSSTQPLIHVWLVCSPPDGTLSSGLDILDSAVMLHSMRMFQTGFYSPYATCRSPYGMQYPGYFPIPFQWVYGVFGVIADGFGWDHFLFYGFINGAGMLLFLAAAYGFLREVVPKCANRAFLLFSLSGGLGGIAYIVTAVTGLQRHPSFEAYFFRYAMYELIEGANCLPVCCQPRFYYTAALGLCLAGLTAVIRAVRTSAPKDLVWASVLLLAGSGLNLRYGTFTWAIAMLFLWLQGRSGANQRIRAAAAFTAPVVLAGLLTRHTMRMSPVIVENAVSWSNVATWFSALLSTLGLHLFLAPREVAGRLRGLTLLPRALAWGAIGYLGAFALLYAAYQAYYGNILMCRDFRVAVDISDWALIGAALAATAALVRRRPSTEPDDLGWVVVWLLAFTSLTISAFGRGWFLRFGPQRLQPLMWLPVCMCSALALERMSVQHRTRARCLTAALVTCGVSSILVAVLCFQGPLQFNRDGFPYSYLHAELMTEADARMLNALGDGRVMTLPSTADAIVQKHGNPVVCGVGSFNLTDQPYLLLRGEVDRFFSKDTSDENRKAIAEKWCIDCVLCPDTRPVDEETVRQLRAAPWLSETASEGRAVLFEVVTP